MNPKILYLLPYFGVAGTEIHTLELAKFLKDDYQILVVAPYGKGINLLKENDISYKEIIPLTFANIRRYKKILKCIIEEFDPNIIHVHGAHELVYISKSIAPNIPVIFTCHGYATFLPFIDYKISAFINKRWGDKVIAVSNYEKENLIKAGLPIDKITLIYNGISETLEKRELPIKLEGFIIGTAARLTKSKGIRYLIEAFSYLYDKYRGINLVIIGDGEEREKLEESAKKLNVKDRTFFLGALPNARFYFRDFHIFVLPSLFEALGIVILEAISQKVPVIATNIGGIPEIIEDGKTGLLVPPKDSLTLARAMEKLIKNKELREYLGEEGNKRYKERFTLEAMVIKTKEVYKVLLDCSN
ncbi:glycosyltransferase family 4 protein [bacterium]|nr:glycosyltransferase family 4 protein [bacterium]